MAKDAGDTTGFREEKIELDFESMDDLDSIYGDLEGGMDSHDKEIKMKLAKTSLKLMDDTALSHGIIQHYSKVLSKFSDFKFDDELDDVFKDSWKIINSSDVDGSQVIPIWKGMHSKLSNYVARG